MYSTKKIPAPFNGNPPRKASALSEKTKKIVETPPTIHTTENSVPPHSQKHSGIPPLLALCFLERFANEKKDG